MNTRFTEALDSNFLCLSKSKSQGFHSCKGVNIECKNIEVEEILNIL